LTINLFIIIIYKYQSTPRNIPEEGRQLSQVMRECSCNMYEEFFLLFSVFQCELRRYRTKGSGTQKVDKFTLQS